MRPKVACLVCRCCSRGRRRTAQFVQLKARQFQTAASLIKLVRPVRKRDSKAEQWRDSVKYCLHLEHAVEVAQAEDALKASSISRLQRQGKVLLNAWARTAPSSASMSIGRRVFRFETSVNETMLQEEPMRLRQSAGAIAIGVAALPRHPLPEQMSISRGDLVTVRPMQAGPTRSDRRQAFKRSPRKQTTWDWEGRGVVVGRGASHIDVAMFAGPPMGLWSPEDVGSAI